MEKETAFFCSWSGGKDSCLALYKAIQSGGKPRYLLTMLTEDGSRSRSHGLPLPLIQRQALALDLPLLTARATWENYETAFSSLLMELKGKEITAGVFGDIDIEDHREWVIRVCTPAGIRPYHFLWQKPRNQLLREFLSLHFKATIVVIKEGKLDPHFLGKTLDEALVSEFEKSGIDPSGERGEYHTVVTDGPIFSFPVPIQTKGVQQQEGYQLLEVTLP